MTLIQQVLSLTCPIGDPPRGPLVALPAVVRPSRFFLLGQLLLLVAPRHRHRRLAQQRAWNKLLIVLLSVLALFAPVGQVSAETCARPHRDGGLIKT